MTTLERQLNTLERQLTLLKRKIILPFSNTADSQTISPIRASLRGARRRAFQKFYGGNKTS